MHTRLSMPIYMHDICADPHPCPVCARARARVCVCVCSTVSTSHESSFHEERVSHISLGFFQRKTKCGACFLRTPILFLLFFFCIKVKLSTMRNRIPYICRFFVWIYDFVGFYILKLYPVFAEMQHFPLYGYKIQRLSSLCVLIFDKEFFLNLKHGFPFYFEERKDTLSGFSWLTMNSLKS